MKPLLKWVGSKRWIQRRIGNLVRKYIADDGIYWEPFVGAGAVLFEVGHLSNHKIISDIVEPLILTYSSIKEEPMEVWKWTKKYGEEGYDKKTYLRLRERFNDIMMARINTTSDYEVAGLFIYLNHTCYNGLWRQNKLGEFNVPYGDRKRVKLPTQIDFLGAYRTFGNTDIEHYITPLEALKDIELAKKGDVVFSDPPYIGTFSGYDGYSIPSRDFHEELVRLLRRANKRGVKIIAMNTFNELTKKWYGDFCDIEDIERYQGVASDVDGRGEWHQLLAIGK